MKRGEQIPKNVSSPSNPPDELAQNISKKSPSDELFLHFSAKVQNLSIFNYLHASNSIFRARGIKSEWVSGGTVTGYLLARRGSTPHCVTLFELRFCVVGYETRNRPLTRTHQSAILLVVYILSQFVAVSFASQLLRISVFASHG